MGSGGAASTRKQKSPASSCPPPLVPADCDLTGLPSILLDRSIAKSDLAALSTGDEFKAAILLYTASYDQLPAGSLPDDNRILGFLSHAGGKWGKVRPMALRGWVLCSDGRLYHPVTAEKVLSAWVGRLRQRLASGEGNKVKYGGDFDRSTVDAQIAAALAAFEALNPSSPELAKLKRSQKKSPTGSPSGNPGGKHSGLPPRSQAEGKGEAEGLREGSSQSETSVVIDIREARS